MLPVEVRANPIPPGGMVLRGEVASPSKVIRGLNDLVEELSDGLEEQLSMLRALPRLPGDQEKNPLIELTRINNDMLPLNPNSSEYKDLEWEQRRAIGVINAGEPSFVDRVIFFFEEVF